MEDMQFKQVRHKIGDIRGSEIIQDVAKTCFLQGDTFEVTDCIQLVNLNPTVVTIFGKNCIVVLAWLRHKRDCYLT